MIFTASLRKGAALVAIVIGTIAMMAGAAPAQAAWPERPLTVVVPFTPGTSMDTLARIISPKLSQSLGQPVIVENRPGASGNIGTGYVAHAAPDGYTLLMTVSTFAMNPKLFKRVPYDPLTSFEPVGRVALGALVFAVNPDFPASTLQQAIEAFRSHPGKYAYASPGNGTPQHLAMELFKLHAGVDVMHVPYSGSAGAVTDLLGGQVDAMILPANTALPLKDSGKLRILAATQDRRIPVMPDVPTLAESGVHDADVSLWFGMLAPARTPADVIARLNAEITRILSLPEIQASLDKQGLAIAPDTPSEFGALVSAETARWADVIKQAGITGN